MNYTGPRIVTPPPGPRAQEVIERDLAMLSPSLTRTAPLVGYKAEGVYVEDVDGNVFLDFGSGTQRLAAVLAIERICGENRIDFVNLGTVAQPDVIRHVPSFIQATSRVSLSATIGSRRDGILDLSIKEAARAIKRISSLTDRGYGNFRFAAIANCR